MTRKQELLKEAKVLIDNARREIYEPVNEHEAHSLGVRLMDLGNKLDHLSRLIGMEKRVPWSDIIEAREDLKEGVFNAKLALGEYDHQIIKEIDYGPTIDYEYVLGDIYRAQRALGRAGAILEALRGPQ